MRAVILPGRAEGVTAAPPSKSMAHRLLICAGLSTGESEIRNIALSEDILATIDCLRALGAGPTRMLIRHVIPNMIPHIVVLFTTRVGRCVLSIASLSYLGLGIRPPTPDCSPTTAKPSI